MSANAVIRAQFLAALAMLEQAITRCPAALWEAGTPPFWQLAYHTLFYTHLYLQPDERHFHPWARQRGEAQVLGRLEWENNRLPVLAAPYTQAEVLAYLDHCRHQVITLLPTLDLDATESGFPWLPFGKLELQIYSMRHLQQHTRELCQRLSQAQVNVDWVGRVG